MSGSITDPGQAAVPEASLKITNSVTHESRSTKSGPTGEYSFTQLAPGTYELSVSKSGFKQSINGSVTVQANQPTVLNVSLAVEAARQEVNVTASIDAVKEEVTQQLASIAGGTSLIDSSEVEKGRVFTNQDLLAYQPGVYAQAASGADGLKLSIRGSAIDFGTNYFRSGTLTSFDGLPVSGPGGTPYELFEPLGLSYTEVLRGANAFDAGSLNLGGAINYISQTGRDPSAYPIQVRLEGGSYGYEKFQVSSGQVIGAADYFISVTGSHRNGFQDHSEGGSFGVASNFGYQFNDKLQTHFYYRYRQTSNQLPGELTLAQLDANPRQSAPGYIENAAGRFQPGSNWIANKTTYSFNDNSRLVGGFVYHDYPIDIHYSDGGRGVWGFQDLTGLLQYDRHDTFLGIKSDTELAGRWTSHIDGYLDATVRVPGSSRADEAGPVGTSYYRSTYGGSDRVFTLSNHFTFPHNLSIMLGISGIDIRRETQLFVPVVADNYDRHSWNYAPRLGVEYGLSNRVQIFGNISRSVEPPNSWTVLGGPPFPSGPAVGYSETAIDLKDQTATTYEIGTKGTLKWLGQWNVDFYRANVKNELLEVETSPATATTSAIVLYANASPTIHQGVEFGLNTPLFEGKLPTGDRLSVRNTYTFSDFYYTNDPTFHANQLPGLPGHFYQGQLSYSNHLGFYVTPSAQVASAYPVDYANSFYSRGYFLLGTTLGYGPPKGHWTAHLDFINLTNAHYAAAINVGYNDLGADVARSDPGDGRSVFAGVSLHF